MVDAAGPCGATKALAPEMAARAIAEVNFMVVLYDEVSHYKCKCFDRLLVEVVGGGSECAVYSRVSGWLTYVVGVFRLCLFSPPVFAVFCVCFDTKGSRAAFGTATPPKAGGIFTSSYNPATAFWG